MVVLALAPALRAQTAPDAAELTRLLQEFLSGASRNDAAVHDRFWAPDLIYTRSAGRRVGKAEILEGLRTAPPAPAGAPRTTYTAEDVRIQQYGDTALVAFRLVGTTQREGKTEVARFLNTGTFLKRDGKWQAVGWQSTRVPRPEEEAKPQAVAAERAFHQALQTADVKSLGSLLDEGFVWTHSKGERQTRQDLLDQLSSGRLRYSKLETSDVTVSVHGDTAVVRGASPRQRSAFPGSPGGDPAPFTAFFTLTLVHHGDGWKAVALHTSRAP
jgi:hypothetical protein